MPRKGSRLSPAAAERQAAAVKKWQSEHTIVLTYRVRREKAEAYKRLAARQGRPLATIVQELLDAEIAKSDM